MNNEKALKFFLFVILIVMSGVSIAVCFFENERVMTAENQSSVKKGNTTVESDANNEVKKNFEIIDRKISWGFKNSSDRGIDTIVLHSSYNALGGDEYDPEKLIGIYKSYNVAPHYVIGRKGDIYKLVDDEDIAYHAGISKMPSDGRRNVNNFSIGIELINNKEDEYDKEQYEALQYLIDYLKDRYSIEYVLGHDEIAPERKTDPWNFDWGKIDK